MSDKRSVRVLLVINELDWFWSHRLPLAKGILDNGWELSVACHNATRDKRLSQMGIQPIELPQLGKLYNPIAYLKFVGSILSTIRKVKPSVVHTITLKYALYIGLITRCMRYKPVIFTVAGLGSLYSSSSPRLKILKFVSKPILKFALGGRQSYVIFQNPDDKKILLSANILVEKNTALIRGSGIDLDAYPYVPYDNSNSEPIVLFASRLLRDKGILDFIEAAKKLNEQGVKAKFLVAGDLIKDNPRFIDLNEIEEPHDSGVIEWLGKVPNIQQLLECSMLFVFPSYYGEGVPRVLLEAASTGRPIVTCDVPGCREVVQHGVNGILVSPRNPQELADSIKDLILDAKKRARYASEGRRLVEDNFHDALVVSKTLDVYRGAFEDIHKQS